MENKENNPKFTLATFFALCMFVLYVFLSLIIWFSLKG